MTDRRRSRLLEVVAALGVAASVADAETIVVTGATIHPISGDAVERGVLVATDGVIVADGERWALIVAFAEHAFEQQMFDHVAPHALVPIGADAEGGARRILLVETIAGLAEQMVHHAPTPDALIEAHDGGDGFRGELGGVD